MKRYVSSKCIHPLTPPIYKDNTETKVARWLQHSCGQTIAWSQVQTALRGFSLQLYSEVLEQKLPSILRSCEEAMKNCLLTASGGQGEGKVERWLVKELIFAGSPSLQPHPLSFWENHKLLCQDSDKLCFKPFLDLFTNSQMAYLPSPLGSMPWS